jgi:2-C-methyl-D-erythritol 4-phosphate cytidylyltransferase
MQKKPNTPNWLAWGASGACSWASLASSPDFRIYDEAMTINRAYLPLDVHSEARSKALFFALIPCAGLGSRAGSAGAKQYQIIDGQAMVLHTLAAFSKVARLTKTLVVVAPGDRFFDALPLKSFDVAACGGESRADSVRNGLQALRDAGASAHDWVLVHDAARCLVTPAQITYLMEACEDDAVGGLLAHKLADTLKSERPYEAQKGKQASESRVAATLDRSDKWLAQTPQMFRIGMLIKALDAAGGAVTDESSAIEALGLAPKLVAGSAQNFKVTYPEDFALAEAILVSRRSAG